MRVGKIIVIGVPKILTRKQATIIHDVLNTLNPEVVVHDGAKVVNDWCDDNFSKSVFDSSDMIFSDNKNADQVVSFRDNEKLQAAKSLGFKTIEVHEWENQIF